MIHLRELKIEDAPLMYEWMQDVDSRRWFVLDFKSFSLEDAKEFCKKNRMMKHLSDGVSIHYAIAGDNDEYLGTISLKNIDLKNMSAEYAISLRKVAQNHGIGKCATMLLLEKAFIEFRLHRVYLSVLANNESAITLYEKCGFKYEGEFRDHIYKDGKYISWKWYGLLNDEYQKMEIEQLYYS